MPWDLAGFFFFFPESVGWLRGWVCVLVFGLGYSNSIFYDEKKMKEKSISIVYALFPMVLVLFQRHFLFNLCSSTFVMIKCFFYFKQF